MKIEENRLQHADFEVYVATQPSIHCSHPSKLQVLGVTQCPIAGNIVLLFSGRFECFMLGENRGTKVDVGEI